MERCLKVLTAVAILVALLAFGSPGLPQTRAEYRRQTEELIQGKPANVFAYVGDQLDWGGEVFRKLAGSGKPSALFNKESIFGFGVTVVENILVEEINLVAGLTLKNSERGKFLVGLEYTGLTFFSGGIWDILKKFAPTIYLVEGRVYYGFSYQLQISP